MDVLVSVVIPFHNAGAHLERCIRSVVGQSWAHIQLILIDDGSTDFSAQICLDYTNNDDRVGYHYQDNAGVSSARNHGLQLARGSFVMFVDGDDWLEAMAVETLVSVASHTGADVVCFDYVVDYTNHSFSHSENSSLYGHLDRERAVGMLMSTKNRFVWSRFFSSSVLQDSAFRIDLHWGEDTVFVCEALLRAARIYYTRDVLYHYYQSPKSATRSGLSQRKLSGLDAGLYFVDLTQAQFPRYLSRARAAYAAIVVELLFDSLAVEGANPQLIDFLRRELRRVIPSIVFSPAVPLRSKASFALSYVWPRCYARLHQTRLARIGNL